MISPYTKRPIERKPVLPPAFDFSNDFKKLAQLSQELDNLRKEHDSLIKQTLQKHSDTFQTVLDKKIKEIDVVLQRVLEIQKGEPGIKGDTPVAGKDYPIPKNGKPGLDAVVNEKKIAQMVVKLIPKEDIVPKIDHTEIADKVIELLQTGKKKLSIKHIGDFTDGLEQTMRPIRSLMAGFRGGGDVVTSGTGITITTDSDGKKVITSSVGGTNLLSATEIPNGSLKVFTFSTATAQPDFLVVDNVWMRATTALGTVNWTWSAGLKQATLSIPSVDEIFAIIL